MKGAIHKVTAIKKKLVIKIIVTLMLFAVSCMQLTHSVYARILDDDVGDWGAADAPAIELRIIEVKNGTDDSGDKQVIALLRAYNMEFSTLDLNLTYDNSIICPSDLETNEPINDTSSEHWSINASDIAENANDDYSENIDFWWVDNLPQWLQYIISIFIPEVGGNPNAHEDENYYYSSITAGENGITLAKLSFRLAAGATLDESTFTLKSTDALPTGIHVVSSITDDGGDLEYNEYYDPRLFRVTLDIETDGYIEGSILTNATKHIANVYVFPSYPEIDWTQISSYRQSTGELALTPEATAQTDDAGNFSIAMPPGTYDILIDKAGYLDFIFTKVVVEDGKITEVKQYTEAGSVVTFKDQIQLLAGDVNKDGVVSLRDLGALKDAMDTQENISADYNKACDFNDDGWVSIRDLGPIKDNMDKGRTILNYKEDTI